MNAVVVYESIYGNTRAVAEAVAEGLGGAPVHPVTDAGATAAEADLVVVGGPTHMHGMTTALSRRAAVDGAKEDGHTQLEPGAADDPGLRPWLRELGRHRGARAAAFDTRLDRSSALTGSAARAIARRLRLRGFEVLDTASFMVEDAEGPLEEGELQRARQWGAELAARAV